MKRTALAIIGIATLFGAASARAAIIAPSYVVSERATPGLPTGGVTAVGEAILVGVGPFGGATQSVVRLDGGGATTVADGFNALAGFAYDGAGARLFVGDNGLSNGSLPGSETGDTIYEIPDPLGHAGPPLRARDLELLPPNSIPGMFDLVLDPNDPSGDSLFATDSSEDFPSPNGRLLAVDAAAGAFATLHSGLDFSAGIAATADTLFLGELDASDFTGRVSTTALPDGSGAFSPLVTGLPGLFDLVMASDGTLLATVSAFDSSEIQRFDAATGGLLEVVASGLDFATALDEQDGVIYAIEGGSEAQARVLIFTPIPEPAPALGLALGLAALAAHARRRAREVV